MLQTGTDFAIHIRENRSPFPARVVFPQAKPGTRWFHPWKLAPLALYAIRTQLN